MRPTITALALSGLVLLVALVWSPLGSHLTLSNLLEQARPAGTLPTTWATLLTLQWPNEHISHDYKVPAGWLAFATAAGGFVFATLFYGVRKLDADEARRTFAGVYRFLLNKWWFDELYQVLFVKPVYLISGWVSWIDKRLIDGLIDGLAKVTRGFAVIWDRMADRQIVDGFANGIAHQFYQAGLSLRRAQTGQVRQYVMFIAVGTVAVFMIISFFWKYAFAG
jgi:NADH-quinone oxidoreductase subunit L